MCEPNPATGLASFGGDKTFEFSPIKHHSTEVVHFDQSFCRYKIIYLFYHVSGKPLPSDQASRWLLLLRCRTSGCQARSCQLLRRAWTPHDQSHQPGQEEAKLGKRITLGWEPWSSGFRRRLIFRRSRVRIPTPYTGWTFFHINLLQN